MTLRRTFHKYLGIGFLVVANVAAAQVPTKDSTASAAIIPIKGTLWSLGAGTASGEKGLAGFLSTGSQRQLLSTELRLSYAEASAPNYPWGSPLNDRGPISALEVAALGGIGKRTRRTLSAVRVGLGIVSRKQCVQNCGFFNSREPTNETVRTVGLAYALETGVHLGRRRSFGVAAIIFGNANSAHSFVSGGGRLSIGSWK